MKKFTLYTLIFTVSCFSASFILGKISEKNQDTKYWNLAAKAYSGHLNKDFQTRKISKDIEINNLNTVEIHGISTDIKIEKSNDHQIHIIYSDKTSQSATLTEIDFVKQDKNKILIDFEKMHENDKHVNLNMTSLFNFNLEIEDANATIQIPSEIANVFIHTVSGDFEIKNNIVIDSFNFNSVSGDLEFNLNKNLKQSKINTVSGDILLQLDSEPNLELNFESATGELDFDTSLKTANISNFNADSKLDHHLTLGNGFSKLNVETVSGDVEIKK